MGQYIFLLLTGRLIFIEDWTVLSVDFFLYSVIVFARCEHRIMWEFATSICFNFYWLQSFLKQYNYFHLLPRNYMFCKNPQCEYINAKLNDTVDFSHTFNSSINVSFVLYISEARIHVAREEPSYEQVTS